MVPYIDIGPLRVGTHDFFTVLALTVGFAIYYIELRRRSMLDDRIVAITLVGVVGGVVGSRLLLAWEHLDWYGPALATHSLTWVIENSGKSIIGAVVGAYLAMVAAKRALHYTRSTGDSYAFALPVGMIIGRVGCFLSELPLGKPTDLPWGIAVDPAAASTFVYCPGCELPMHPTMLYEIGFNVLVGLGLWRARRRFIVSGDLIRAYLLAAAVFRFAVEFIRTSPPQLAGLTAPQLVLIPIVVFLVVHFIRRLRSGVYRMPPAPAPTPTPAYGGPVSEEDISGQAESDSKSTEEIAGYIRQNRERYTRDAIRAELLRRGFAEPDVEAALAASYAASTETVGTRARTLAIALGAYLLAAVVVSIRFAGGGTYLPSSMAAALPFALAYFTPGFLISAVLIVITNRKPVPREEIVGAVLIGLALPSVLLLAMAGFCLSLRGGG